MRSRGDTSIRRHRWWTMARPTLGAWSRSPALGTPARSTRAGRGPVAARAPDSAPGQSRGDRVAWLFLLPSLIGVTVFSVVPILAALAISVTRWDVLTEPRFIGVANYAELFGDPLF